VQPAVASFTYGIQNPQPQPPSCNRMPTTLVVAESDSAIESQRLIWMARSFSSSDAL
jgi:hypothetical protein